MNILILGAGQVGRSLAENLMTSRNNITIVDESPIRLEELHQRYDIRTVAGSCTSPETLRDAGCNDADLLIAVTDNDATNMLACQIAWSLFRTPTKISWVRDSVFSNYPQMFTNKEIPVDVLVSPGKLVTEYITRLMQYPGTIQVLDLLSGRVKLLGVPVETDGILDGATPQILEKLFTQIQVSIVGIMHREKMTFPDNKTVFKAGSELFLITLTENVNTVLQRLKILENPYNQVVIGGGGNIALNLAKKIEKQCTLKIIESDRTRSLQISEHLDRALVLHGSIMNDELLIAENIYQADLFCALTSVDEVNIMSSLLARQLGVRKVITLINNIRHLELFGGSRIDITFSPHEITISTVLNHIHHGDTTSAQPLHRFQAEAIEIVVHGDRETSKVVGKRLQEIELPEDVVVATIARDDKIIFAHPETTIHNNDHVLLIVLNRQRIADIERLFRVGLGFF